MNRLVGFSEVLELNVFLRCIQQSTFYSNRYFYYSASKPKKNVLQSLDLLLAIAVEASLTVEDFSIISFGCCCFLFPFLTFNLFDIEDETQCHYLAIGINSETLRSKTNAGCVIVFFSFLEKLCTLKLRLNYKTIQ